MKIQFILSKYLKDTKRSFNLKSVSDNVVNKVKSTSQIIDIYSPKLKFSNNSIYKSVIYIIFLGNKHLLNNTGFNTVLLFRLWQAWQ